MTTQPAFLLPCNRERLPPRPRKSTRLSLAVAALLAAACDTGTKTAGTGPGGATPGFGGGSQGGAGGSGGGTGGSGGSTPGTAGRGGGQGPGGAGGRGGSSGYTSDGLACWEYIKVYCKRRDECRGVEERECLGSAAQCPMRYFLEGSTRTPESLRECARSWATFDCDKLIRGWYPPCATPGTRAGGETCRFGSQCASLVCNSGGPKVGTCTRTASPGEACSVEVSCPNGQSCIAGGACGPRPIPEAGTRLGPAGDVGAPCKFLDECKLGGFCQPVDIASVIGQCATLPSAGAACGKKNEAAGYPQLCDDVSYCGKDLLCHERLSLGSVCVLPGSLASDCAAGAYCSTASGICEPAKPIGATCDGAVDYLRNLEREVAECDASLGAECMCPSGYGVCGAKEGICAIPVEPGEACDFPWSRCVFGSTCVNGRCDYPWP